jgi:hypothetical protein
LVEKLKRKLDRAERAAAMSAHAVLLDGLRMLGRAVAVLSENYIRPGFAS